MPDDLLTLVDLQEILAIPDAVEANRRITAGYHQLSQAMRVALGTADDLDWCGFAKWSSHTVGFEINPNATPPGGTRLNLIADELTDLVLPDAIENVPFLHSSTQTFMKNQLRLLVTVADNLARHALRAGNLTIFAEMGRTYVALLARLSSDATATAGTDEEFAARVAHDVVSAPGRTLPAPLTTTHLELAPVDHLSQALLFYLRAARDTVHRSELILAGNVAFSRFEQHRADRLIAIGLCTPARAHLIPVINAAAQFLGGTDKIDESSGLLEGSEHPHPIVRAVDHLVVTRITHSPMFVEIGLGTSDTPAPRVQLGHPETIPASTVAVTLPEVTALLAEQQSNAAGVSRDWLRLPYRMSVIARYFAAFQREPGAQAAPPA